MGFFNGAEDLELFLTRCCYLSIGSVPAWWGATAFFIKEEGWHFSFLVSFVFPLIAACLGGRGSREIRVGPAATGLVLALVTMPLTFVLAYLEGS